MGILSRGMDTQAMTALEDYYYKMEELGWKLPIEPPANPDE
jgi:hypothetical protein